MNEEYVGVQLAWKRIIAIAQDLPDPATIHLDYETESTSNDRSYAMFKALQHMLIITTQVEGYIAFMITMTNELDYCCPTSLSFLRHIIECSEIPTAATLRKISSLFISSHDLLSNERKINQYILWAMLAQKFAGHLSHAMWIDAMYDMLVHSITSSNHPMLRLHALLVFESFSMNGHFKKIYMHKRLHHTLCQVQRNMDRKKKFKKLLNFYKPKRQDWTDVCQLRFLLSWLLSHLFLENPVNTRPKIKWKLNFVNPRHQCKISRDGLEIRNDRQQFESFFVSSVLSKGRWYYEVLILTNGIIQLGLSNTLSTKEQGFGIGIENNGFAFDTYQSGIWIKDEMKMPKEKQRCCMQGDVIGCLIDLENMKCVYYMNGHEFSVHVQLGDVAKKGVLPIVCLTGYQHIKINVGHDTWFYKPPNHVNPLKLMLDRPVLTNKGNLKDENDDWDGPQCTLCFSETKDVILLPCRHEGFGKKCAEKLITCPICRTEIKDKTSNVLVQGVTKNVIHKKFQL